MNGVKLVGAGRKLLP